MTSFNQPWLYYSSTTPSWLLSSAKHLLLTIIAMLKSFPLISIISATSILFIVDTAFSNPRPSGSIYPEFPSSDIDQPVCYMQTVDDRTLNLNRLCEKKIRLIVQPPIVITNIIQEGDSLRGILINKIGKTVYNARVNYEVIGENDSVIDKGVIYADKPMLNPGQTVTFATYMPNDKKVRTTSVEWSNTPE